MTKREFTKKLLEPLVKEITSYNVSKLEYVKATPSNEEYVLVWYEWDDGFGQKQSFRKQICVTADSLSAMAVDVINKVK